MSTIRSIVPIQGEITRLASIIDAPPEILPRYDLTPEDEQDDFIVIEGDQYVFIRTEPMGQFEKIRTKSEDELLYQVFECITFQLAEKATIQEYQPEIECRRFLWPKQAKLMGKLSLQWLARLEMAHTDTLATWPYKDVAAWGAFSSQVSKKPWWRFW